MQTYAYTVNSRHNEMALFTIWLYSQRFMFSFAGCREQIISAFNEVSLIAKPISSLEGFVIMRAYCICKFTSANHYPVNSFG